MRVLQPFEEKIRLQIRNELALKPVITMHGLKERIEEVFGRGFDYEYIRKLTGKVRNEIVVEIDRAKIEPRLAFMRENYRMIREELLKIVYWTPATAVEGVPKPLAKDRVEAAKAVVQLDLAILQAEAAAGMYRKSPEDLAKSIPPYEPLPGEVRAVIVAAWQRGGLLPKATVEAMLPEQPEVAQTSSVTAQS
jgi:hypothetical protein